MPLLLACSNTVELEQRNEFYSLELISCKCDPIEIIPFPQQWKFDFATSEIEVDIAGDLKQD